MNARTVSRAAEGEDISETTDLRKEIRLEILRLKQNKEPEKATPENVMAMYNGSVVPLIRVVAGSLADYCEIFAENFIRMEMLTSAGASQTLQEGILSPDFSSYLKDIVPVGDYISSVDVSFWLKGFLRGGYKTFDLNASLHLRCEDLKYSVQTTGVTGLAPIIHFYQESITPDEMHRYAEGVARHFLETIRKNTKD